MNTIWETENMQLSIEEEKQVSQTTYSQKRRQAESWRRGDTHKKTHVSTQRLLRFSYKSAGHTSVAFG